MSPAPPLRLFSTQSGWVLHATPASRLSPFLRLALLQHDGVRMSALTTPLSPSLRCLTSIFLLSSLFFSIVSRVFGRAGGRRFTAVF